MTQWVEIRHQYQVAGVPKKELARRVLRSLAARQPLLAALRFRGALGSCFLIVRCDRGAHSGPGEVCAVRPRRRGDGAPAPGGADGSGG